MPGGESVASPGQRSLRKEEAVKKKAASVSALDTKRSIQCWL
jgi:hypothetical protein